MANALDIKGYASLGSDVNKPKVGEPEEAREGIVSTKLPELTLDMSNEDIVKLADQWESEWKESDKKKEWEKQIEENEKYWLGKQHNLPQQADGERPGVDNLIFEAVETYLPQATRRNPEPLVALDPSELDAQGNEDPSKTAYVLKVKNKLADIGDKNKLRLKLKKGARHWSIYQLGVAKYGWNLDKDIPSVSIVRPQKIILDPEATIDEDGYTGERIGEYRKLPSSRILAIIGNEETPEAVEAKKLIAEKVGDKTGTTISFIEWWTPEYMCWKLDKTILLKKKNPHWNYDKQEPNENTDEYGNVTQSQEEKPGLNHFPSPKMPYEFLSVFNLGDQPMDKTSLINQNLSNQDLINKRNKQISDNVDDMNGGIVVSMARSGLTQPQAANVGKALRKRGVVMIPDGVPREAIDKYPAPGLPSDVYNQLLDTRTRLRDIFGVRGSSTAGLTTEETVRGKIIGRGLDTDRIGGGVTEFLEQFADGMYNWFLQLLYVYDSGFQFIYGTIPPKVSVSVKEGSLLPKDSTSIANQALELARMNKISNLDLYKRLEWPNPEEVAANVWLEVNAPHLLYRDNPLVQEAVGMMQAAEAEKAAAAQADAELKHKQGLEKQNATTEGNIRTEAAKSVLAEVPQNQQT